MNEFILVYFTIVMTFLFSLYCAVIIAHELTKIRDRLNKLEKIIKK